MTRQQLVTLHHHLVPAVNIVARPLYTEERRTSQNAIAWEMGNRMGLLTDLALVGQPRREVEQRTGHTKHDRNESCTPFSAP